MDTIGIPFGPCLTHRNCAVGCWWPPSSGWRLATALCYGNRELRWGKATAILRTFTPPVFWFAGDWVPNSTIPPPSGKCSRNLLPK